MTSGLGGVAALGPPGPWAMGKRGEGPCPPCREENEQNPRTGGHRGLTEPWALGPETLQADPGEARGRGAGGPRAGVFVPADWTPGWGPRGLSGDLQTLRFAQVQ